MRVLLWEWVATPIDKGKDVRGKEGCEGSRYYLFSMGSAYWARTSSVYSLRTANFVYLARLP